MMPLLHSFDLGDRVRVYQMHPSKGLLFEGLASIVELEDADEYYLVRFDNEPDETYQRFVDRDGQAQDNPADYIAAFNKRIGYPSTDNLINTPRSKTFDLTKGK